MIEKLNFFNSILSQVLIETQTINTENEPIKDHGKDIVVQSKPWEYKFTNPEKYSGPICKGWGKRRHRNTTGYIRPMENTVVNGKTGSCRGFSLL